jgi:hypothetical protein
MKFAARYKNNNLCKHVTLQDDLVCHKIFAMRALYYVSFIFNLELILRPVVFVTSHWHMGFQSFK